MANKPQYTKQEIPPVNDNLFNLKRVHFIKDIPIFLNYVNKVEAGEFELTIQTPAGQTVSFLFIRNKTTKQSCIVPLTSVASADLS